MSSLSAKPNRLPSIIACFWLCMVIAGVTSATSRISQRAADTCVACHSRDQVVTLYQTSTHGKMSIGCDGCHGGDSSQTEKAKAHAGHFVARPDTAATLEM